MTPSLSNKRALVLGATGNVGHGVVQAMLAAGASVLAPTRSAERARELAQAFPKGGFEPIVGDISDATSSPALAQAVAERGPIDHVVASLGPWWQGGPVAEQDPQEWARVRAMLLDGHVHAAELFLPRLHGREGASYTIITGMGAHHVMPGTSLLYVATGGVLSLSKVLRAEYERGPVRVNEVLISARIEKRPRSGVIESAVFGEAIVSLVTGERRGEVVEFPEPRGR